MWFLRALNMHSIARTTCKCLDKNKKQEEKKTTQRPKCVRLMTLWTCPHYLYWLFVLALEVMEYSLCCLSAKPTALPNCHKDRHTDAAHSLTQVSLIISLLDMLIAHLQRAVWLCGVSVAVSGGDRRSHKVLLCSHWAAESSEDNPPPPSHYHYRKPLCGVRGRNIQVELALTNDIFCIYDV